MMSPAAWTEPVVGTCYASTTVNSYDLDARTMKKVESCDVKHASETVYVGTAKSTFADMVEPYAECGKVASDYLGEDWHGARVDLVLFTPTALQWGAGARFVWCDLVETTSDRDVIVPRTSSLKGGLRGDRLLAITCATLIGETKTSVEDTAAVPCTKTHRIEYAGFTLAPAGPYPPDEKSFDQAFRDLCHKVVADYTGMTLAQFNAHRQVGSMWWATGRAHWENGDRSARCYVWLPAVPDMSRSVRGMGNKSL